MVLVVLFTFSEKLSLYCRLIFAVKIIMKLTPTFHCEIGSAANYFNPATNSQKLIMSRFSEINKQLVRNETFSQFFCSVLIYRNN